MVRIIDAHVDLESPLGHHRHCLVAQIPTRLRATEHGYALADAGEQWRLVRSVLEIVAGARNPTKPHFVVFPESAVPADRLDDALAVVAERFRPSTVTMLGMEHVRLSAFRELLQRFRAQNAEALDLVQRDVDAGAPLEVPVNWCAVAVKDARGALRVFLEAKSHPFRGEEFLNPHDDLYRGRWFYLFRSHPVTFNFMVLVCLDYLYRDLYASNIRQIVDHANQLFFTTRQSLDALFVLQCTPKPEHRAYRDVLAGFYGEYLEDTPGVRETVTIFGNCSDESEIEGYRGGGTFGTSAVVLGPRHKLGHVQLAEFSTDDFGGAPVRRLRFGSGTRLWYFALPPPPELDPRSSHVPLKVHRIFRLSPQGAWVELSGDALSGGPELPRSERERH